MRTLLCALALLGAGCRDDESPAPDAHVLVDAAVPPVDGGDDADQVSYETFGDMMNVENLGAFPATRVANGLGWNITNGSAVELEASRAAGAKHGRVQCGWGGVEQQSAPPKNTSQGFTFPTDCAQTLALAKADDIAVTIVAAYGPPYHAILKVTVQTAAPVGATTLSVAFSSGVGGDTLASLVSPYDYVQGFDAMGAQVNLSARHSYPGTLLTGSTKIDATHATLSLASALTVPLAAGTTLTINEILYPAASSNTPNDASVLAYAHYVEYLGAKCAAVGARCDIELWNEPPWGDDCWDNRSDCYDTNPGYNEEGYGPNWGFAAALQTTTPPAGVTYTWAGTNKSGDSSLLTPHLQTYAGVTFTEPATAVTAESLHPYGSNPEDATWNLPCLIANVDGNWFQCNVESSSTSNALEAMQLTLKARETNASYGLTDVITETGTSSEYCPDEFRRARFALRQYLGYLAGGIEWIEFYRLYEPHTNGETGFSAIEPTDGGYTPLPIYTALAGVVADATQIANTAPVSYKADGSDLTTVAAYAGTYPLDVMQLVGARTGDTVNSEIVVLYQRSFSPTSCGGTAPCWSQLPSPPATATTLTIPAGLGVRKAIDLTTRALVPIGLTKSGQDVTVDVSDDPIAILLTP